MTFRTGSAAKAVRPAARAWRAAASVDAPGPRLTRRKASTRRGLPSTETVMSAGWRLSGARPSRSTTVMSKEMPGAAAGDSGADAGCCRTGGRGQRGENDAERCGHVPAHVVFSLPHAHGRPRLFEGAHGGALRAVQVVRRLNGRLPRAVSKVAPDGSMSTNTRWRTPAESDRDSRRRRPRRRGPTCDGCRPQSRDRTRGSRLSSLSGHRCRPSSRRSDPDRRAAQDRLNERTPPDVASSPMR